jgi:type 1 glutamine amidotransferase
MQSFDTTDELYTCLAGDRPIDVLATARSKVDGKDYPMAFAFAYGAGRVFHSPLGHDAAALANPAVAELFRRGCAWAAGLDPAARPKRVLLIAGKPSHGKGEHDHENGVMLLKHCLDKSPNAGPIETEVAFNGWPEDVGLLDNLDAILLYADGSEGLPFFATPERQEKIRTLMDRGVGLVCLHFAVAPPRTEAAEALFLQWLGGYYKDGHSKNPVNEVEVTPAAPDHPICRGLKPYTMVEEFYYQLKFDEGGGKIVSIVTGQLPKDAPKPETLAWAFERKSGGRSFGFTGGHFHKSWSVESYRKMVLNAILWTACMDVPQDGVQSTVD